MNELEKRMARELGRYWRALIEEHFFIPRTAKPSEASKAIQELSPTAKLALWGAACRLLAENRSQSFEHLYAIVQTERVLNG